MQALRNFFIFILSVLLVSSCSSGGGGGGGGPAPTPLPTLNEDTFISFVSLSEGQRASDNTIQANPRSIMTDNKENLGWSHLSVRVALDDITNFVDARGRVFPWAGGTVKLNVYGRGANMSLMPPYQQKQASAVIGSSLELHNTLVPTGLPMFWADDATPIMGARVRYKVDSGTTVTSSSTSVLEVLDSQYLKAKNAGTAMLTVTNGSLTLTVTFEVNSWYPGTTFHVQNEGTVNEGYISLIDRDYMRFGPRREMLCAEEVIVDTSARSDIGWYGWPHGPVLNQNSLNDFTATYLDEEDRRWKFLKDASPVGDQQRHQWAGDQHAGNWNGNPPFDQMEHPVTSWYSLFWVEHPDSTDIRQGDFTYTPEKTSSLVVSGDEDRFLYKINKQE